MKRPPDSGRRRLLIVSAGAAAALASGWYAMGADPASDRRLQFGSLATAGDELARLGAAKALLSSTDWSWAQTLVHCAQSIEYSMSGFPQLKSELFRSTVGSTALAFFSWRGRMTHDLAEPIPGAPALAGEADGDRALARLRAAIVAFARWKGPLEPHFAYGQLAKAEYERAHAMHLANHLSGFRASPVAAKA